MGLGRILVKRIGYGLLLLIAVVVLNFTLITIVVLSIAYSVWMELRERRYTTKDDVVEKEERLS